MKEIEEIAEEHSIKDLGRVSPAYQLGFTQGVNYQREIIINEFADHLTEMQGEYITLELINELVDEMKGE